MSPAEQSLGDLIDEAEHKDRRFSSEQITLMESRFDGRPQLVRGVAGSGKSLVLVENLARLIQRRCSPPRPDPADALTRHRFAVVCYNQTLVPFLRSNLEDAYCKLMYCDLPCKVTVDYMNGFMFQLCSQPESPLAYQAYGKRPYPADKAATLARRYSEQLDVLARSNPLAYESLLYDSIYVDEAQDLFEEEYLLLLRLLRKDPTTGDKNLVIFYDDAQNIYGRPRPTWSKLGLHLTGRRSHVMKTCFRNTRPIVEHAFNLLLGVQAETRVATKGFADTAYLKENNLVEELEDRWKVNFADRHDGNPSEVQLFSERRAEKQWVAAQIAHLITAQGVRPEDILVLFEKEDQFYDLEAALRRACPGITKFNKPFGDRENPARKEYILKADHLTLTTVGSAKGYDCPIVFVVGSDLFSNDVKGRATLYVALTRSKMRLYITGLATPNSLAQEAKDVADLLATPTPPSQTTSTAS